MEWFTSDTHFTHASMLRFYPEIRNFANVEEMNEALIARWNALIGPEDRVWHLGDFAWSDVRAATNIARRLNGRKYLITGNHDLRVAADPVFRSMFEAVYDSYAEIVLQGQRIVLCHFPIWEWNQMHNGAWHLHGHLHGKPHGIPGKILDVGVDGNNLSPWSIEDIRRYMDERPVRRHH